MRKIIVFILFLFGIYLSGILSANQVILFNNTNKTVEFSFKFFHKEAKNNMVISGFKLRPREKTRFPQPKDLNLASPLKLKANWEGSPGSVVSKTFSKNSANTYDLYLVEQDGRLKLTNKLSLKKG